LVKKPLGRKSYGHIPHLPGSRVGPGDHMCHEGQKRIVCEKVRNRHDNIIVQEKLDGSNVGVAFLNNIIIPLTRGGYLAQTSPFEQHHHFANWVYKEEKKFRACLNDGERLCAEWLMQAHGTRYKLDVDAPFFVFDLMTGAKRVCFEELTDRVSNFFEQPAIISVGPPVSVEKAMELIGNHGFHGAIDLAEGAVWRVEQRGKFDFICKYVRPDKKDGIYLDGLNSNEQDKLIWNWYPK